MVRTTEADDATDEPTPEHAADVFADDLSHANFRSIVDAVRAEYARDDRDPMTGHILTPTGLAVRVAADALGFDAAGMIDFDGADQITVEYDTFERDDPHATPIELVRLAGLADAATNRNVRFRDGAGSVRIYVDVDRRDD